MARRDGVIRFIANLTLGFIFFSCTVSLGMSPSGIPRIDFFGFWFEKFQKKFSKQPTTKTTSTIDESNRDSHIYDVLDWEIGNRSPGTKKLIVLIVLESLGFTGANEIDRATLSNVNKMINRLKVKNKRLAVKSLQAEKSIGSTLGAELRYLCNVKKEAEIQSYLEGSKHPKSGCLANKVKVNKGSTLYFHEGRRGFYRRQWIMPAIGFERLSFQNESRTTLSKCLVKPFCGDDTDAFTKALWSVEKWAQGQTGSELLFITIMTIDTHAPYVGSQGVSYSYKNSVRLSLGKLEAFLAKLLEVKMLQDVVIGLIPDHPPPLGQASFCKLECQSKNKTHPIYAYILKY